MKRFLPLAGAALISLSAWGSDPNAPVTQKEFKQALRVFKNMVDRFDKLEKKVSSGAAAPKSKSSKAEEEAVDLSSLGSSGSSDVGANAAPGRPTHGFATTAPNFKVFFDFNLVNRPGVVDLSFLNYHSLLLFEMLPDNQLQFSFDINPTPRYYELDYQISPKVQLRAGKIWIPFDDMAPHNIFGGRINTSRLAQPGTSAFLPDLWSELGVGAKFVLVDTPRLSLNAHAYIVNGFQQGGTDPLTGSSVYPSFSDTVSSSLDNNRDKAIGGRVHARFFGRLGFGASYYTNKWSTDGQYGMNMLGLDGQFRLEATGTEIRSGFITMNVEIPGDTYSRGGYYGEFGQKFGRERHWKFLVRGGAAQQDNRVIDVSDQNIVGATLLYKPGLIEYSIEHSRDLKEVAAKANYTYTALRIVVAL